jgi:hypothetical protein
MGNVVYPLQSWLADSFLVRFFSLHDRIELL